MVVLFHENPITMDDPGSWIFNFTCNGSIELSLVDIIYSLMNGSVSIDSSYNLDPEIPIEK